ncbi:response regulator [Microbulbifer epialgicus]|uniref:Response regulator transcription factor n=1 Tax=Microbulbifer epialgicus TaxID=393907 RepID=A0ABV4NWQ7_9GAMM
MRAGLILEDHSPTRKLLFDIMKTAFNEINLLQAVTISQAKKQVKAKGPDIAVVDINLPDGSGLEFVKYITETYSETYCIVTSVLDDERSIIGALEAGAKGYILKDESRDNLLKHFKDINKGKPPLSPAVCRKLVRWFNNNNLPIFYPT